MKRATLAVICVLGLGLSAACGGNGDDRTDATTAQQSDTDVRVSETGCLTARGDQFVLTDLESGEQAAATEAYQLIGKDEELRQHVGKQVRVNGMAEPAQVAVVRETTPPAQEPAQKPTGTAGGGEPAVTTETQTRVEVRKLTVEAFEPTGASCAAETQKP